MLNTCLIILANSMGNPQKAMHDCMILFLGEDSLYGVIQPTDSSNKSVHV